MKVPIVGTEFFHADGQTDRQTDMTKLIVAFRNFGKTYKNFDKTICNIKPLYTQKAIDRSVGIVANGLCLKNAANLIESDNEKQTGKHLKTALLGSFPIEAERQASLSTSRKDFVNDPWMECLMNRFNLVWLTVTCIKGEDLSGRGMDKRSLFEEPS